MWTGKPVKTTILTNSKAVKAIPREEIVPSFDDSTISTPPKHLFTPQSRKLNARDTSVPSSPILSPVNSPGKVSEDEPIPRSKPVEKYVAPVDDELEETSFLLSNLSLPKLNVE